MNSYFWPQEKIDLLVKGYSDGGLQEATKLLPDIPRGTIATKACRMKITNPRPRKAGK